MQDLNPAYNLLLRSELLGASAPGPIPSDKAQQLEQLRSPCSPGKKLFRFKSGDAASPLGGPASPSPFTTSPVGGDDGGLASPLTSPRRAPRKIARAPFKVSFFSWKEQGVLPVRGPASLSFSSVAVGLKVAQCACGIALLPLNP